MKLKILAIVLSCIYSVTASSKSLSELSANYLSEGKKVSEMILSGSFELNSLKTSLHSMADDAAAISKLYYGKNPEGTKVLEEVVNKLGELKNASFDVLEKDWHDLGFFEGKDFGIDIVNDPSHEHFTDPLHCMVHPLMTLRAGESYLKSKDKKHLQTMQEELDEGMEQMKSLTSSDKMK